MKISVLVYETNEAKIVTNRPIAVYLSNVSSWILINMKTNLNAVKNIEYNDTDNAAFYFELIFSITENDGNQLRNDKVIDEYSKNIPHK